MKRYTFKYMENLIQRNWKFSRIAKDDIEGQIIILRATLSTNQQTASRLVYHLLYDGRLLAEGYEVDKDEMTIIPTDYWKSMKLLGEQLSEAGGIGVHHYRNVLIGNNPCYAPETKMLALRCMLPLAKP